MRQEIVIIQSALQRIADLEQKYKLDRDAARAELKLATRALGWWHRAESSAGQ